MTVCESESVLCTQGWQSYATAARALGVREVNLHKAVRPNEQEECLLVADGVSVKTGSVSSIDMDASAT